MTARAIHVEDTSNAKVVGVRRPARVSATYASTQASCPRSCKLYKNGCYGQNGPVGFTERRLSRGAARLSSVTTAKQEAGAIDAAFKGGEVPQDGATGGRDMRLHTVGDAATPKAASILGAAAMRWRARKGGDVWTYTHAWEDVPRDSWGPHVSVLASIDHIDQAEAARAQGYALARYVAEFPATSWVDSGWKHVACPAQTRTDTGCADCRLCLNSERLYKLRIVITFAAHGAQANKVKRRLTQYQGDTAT